MELFVNMLQYVVVSTAFPSTSVIAAASISSVDESISVLMANIDLHKGKFIKLFGEVYKIIDETSFKIAVPYAATTDTVEIIARKPVRSSMLNLWLLIYGTVEGEKCISNKCWPVLVDAFW